MASLTSCRIRMDEKTMLCEWNFVILEYCDLVLISESKITHSLFLV